MTSFLEYLMDDRVPNDDEKARRPAPIQKRFRFPSTQVCGRRGARVHNLRGSRGYLRNLYRRTGISKQNC
ncbi:hypothetical protein CR513_11446, partial [Mucuna pruriens]